jgi:2-polyprenyl-3-methyl-5-hydroxy-6-metoxy-1,4-benzoquinol methylase
MTCGFETTDCARVFCASLRGPGGAQAVMGQQRLLRVVNGTRKVLAGLRPFSESVWPGVANDLFVAHQSLYAFAAAYCRDKRVVDAGCGTGYGTYELAAGGASSALGLDLDRFNIRFARRHFLLPNLRFEEADLDQVDLAPASADVIVASNAIEHLHRPERFLDRARHALAPDGMAIIAVPPVRNSYEQSLHEGIHYHRSVLSVDEWMRLFTSIGFRHRAFLHQARPGVAPDFASRRRSSLGIDDFVFEETDDAGLQVRATITAVFVLHAA